MCFTRQAAPTVPDKLIARLGRVNRESSDECLRQCATGVRDINVSLAGLLAISASNLCETDPNTRCEHCTRNAITLKQPTLFEMRFLSYARSVKAVFQFKDHSKVTTTLCGDGDLLAFEADVTARPAPCAS